MMVSANRQELMSSFPLQVLFCEVKGFSPRPLHREALQLSVAPGLAFPEVSNRKSSWKRNKQCVHDVTEWTLVHLEILPNIYRMFRKSFLNHFLTGLSFIFNGWLNRMCMCVCLMNILILNWITFYTRKTVFSLQPGLPSSVQEVQGSHQWFLAAGPVAGHTGCEAVRPCHPRIWSFFYTWLLFFSSLSFTYNLTG